jgi:branched-chain amino acid transport system permease protein
VRLGAIAATLLVMPLLLADYQRVLTAEILIWGLFAMSFALVFRYGGMLSFAQAVFFGAGCYGFNLATLRFQLNTWGALACAIGLAALLAVPVGYIATRVRHHHFLIVTVILSVLVSTVLSSGHWRWLTGPYVSNALTFVPQVPLGIVTLGFGDELVAYYFTAAAVGIALLLAFLLVESPFGMALLAIRDNEQRAQLIGLDVKRLRWLMFVVAAAVAGLSGCLYALLERYTTLELWDWTWSGKAIVMAILGGTRSLLGPFLGTAFYMVAAESLSRHVEQFTILVGIILLVVVRYAPDGLWGLFARGLALARER